MKKLLPIFIILILLSFLLYYFSVNVNTETITKQSLTINNCTADYVHFKNDNRVKMAETNGHAINNIMELGGAKIQIAKCLCDKYLTEKNVADSIEIVNILNSDEYQYSKKIFENWLDDFKTDTLNLESVCKNKDKYFGRIMLD
jgi:hypothetical protein